MKRTIFIFILTVAFSAAGVAAQEKPAEKTAPTGSIEFLSDGCTWFPDGNYRDCCVAHDREYFAGGSWKQRWRSDLKLFRCVASKPKLYNKLLAPVIWLGVRAGGGAWLKTSFSWGFGKRKKNCDRVSKRKETRN